MLFSENLPQVTWQCIHFAQPKEVATTQIEIGRDLAVFEVDGAQIRTEADLFSAVAKEMQFPDYFGMNWDAFDECLRDMEWLPSKGYVLLFRSAEQFWCQSSTLAGAFVESWLFAAEEWSDKGTAFHLVFVW